MLCLSYLPRLAEEFLVSVQADCALAHGRVLQTLAECQGACRWVLSTFAWTSHFEGIFWNLQIPFSWGFDLFPCLAMCLFFLWNCYGSACDQLAGQNFLSVFMGKTIIIICLKIVGHLHFPYKLLIYLVSDFLCRLMSMCASSCTYIGKISCVFWDLEAGWGGHWTALFIEVTWDVYSKRKCVSAGDFSLAFCKD